MKDIKRFPLAIFAVAALAVGGLASMGDVAYADDGSSVTLNVYQTFDTDAAVNDKFEYCLEASTANAPMPEGVTGNKHCFTMKGDDSNLMTLHIKAGTPELSEYTLRLVTVLPEGYTLSTTDVYQYKLYAHHRDGAVLLAFDGSGKKVEDPGFSLAYKSSPTPPKTPTTPPKTTPPSKSPTPPSKSPTPPEEETPTTPPSTPSPAPKPPTDTLVRTGATVSFGAMLVLLLAGGLLLSHRRETA